MSHSPQYTPPETLDDNPQKKRKVKPQESQPKLPEQEEAEEPEEEPEPPFIQQLDE